MEVIFDFISQGSKVTVDNDKLVCKDPFTDKAWDLDNSVVLDTGNSLQKGIVDHHQPDSEAIESCVAAIIANDPEKYIGHLVGKEKVTIITHYLPDLDALGSVYFTLKYLKKKKFSAQDISLAEYILEVDSGKLTLDPDFPISIASIWLSITNAENKPPYQLDNTAITKKGLKFLEAVDALLDTNNNPWDPNLLNELTGFDEEKNKILEDKRIYQKDLENKSSTGIISLYNNDTGGFDHVDAIFTNRPESILWKYWVRGDRNNSVLKNGFIATCAFYEKRAIIAVDPNCPYNLKGLGLLIDRLELDKLSDSCEIDILINGKENDGPRPWFHRNDPWYDGRGFHSFTIIDAPRAGTILSNDEIEMAFYASKCWRQYGELIDQGLHLEINAIQSLSKPVLYSYERLKKCQELTDEGNFLITGKLEEIQKIGKEIKMTSARNLSQLKALKDASSGMKEVFISELNNFQGILHRAEQSNIVDSIISSLGAQDIIEILMNTNDLGVDAFCKLIAVSESAIKKSEVYKVLLLLQNAHPEAFKPQNKGAVSDALRSNGIDSEKVISIIDDISLTDKSTDFFDEIPLYGFNKLKNYIDDLLVCEALGNQNLSDRTKQFISNDFDSFFGIEEDADFNFIKSHSQFLELRIEFLKDLFGKSYEKIVNSRIDLYKEFKGETAKLIKKYSIEELLKMSYAELISFLDSLKKNISSEDKLNILKNSAFYKGVTVISEFAALNFLYERSMKYYQLQQEIKERDETENPFRRDLHTLIIHLFKLISIYPNAISVDDVETELDSIIELLDELRLKGIKHDFLESQDLRENIGSFIINLKEEVHLEVGEIENQIERATDQYLLLTAEGGIIDQCEQLPFYYRLLTQDILLSFKRYYRERIKFFRSGLSHITDLNYIDNEEKSNQEYINFYNNLINESIKFDWQELKDHVDNEEDEETRILFYKKYFSWQLLNIKHDNNALYKLNSEIRFAEGEKATSLKELVQKLPIHNNDLDFERFLPELAYNWKVNDVVTHFPVQLVHNSYDYLLNTYISKFDVENVRDSLASFSTSFPWYYKFLTNRKIIQYLFLTICLLLLMVGAFDQNIYTIADEEFRSPLSTILEKNIGIGVFGTISTLISGFWATLLSAAFTIPLIYGIVVLYKGVFKRREKDQKEEFKFIQLVSNIEGNRTRLLYLSFILPLLLVVVQMASPDTISMVNNIEGVRLFSTLIIIIGLTLLSVYLSVKDKNQNRTKKWIISKTKHMFWLHLLQAILLTVFVIDLLLRFELSYDMFGSKEELLVLGMSKYIELDFGYFDFRIMPIFTILVSFLTLFFSFFIDKIIGGGEE